MANVICHTCLRTDITAVKLATELTDFVDELCEYNIIDNPKYKYCTICAHRLKKFYNFKQQCLKACKILKSIKGKPKILPTNLHEQIPSSLGFCSSLAPYKLFEHQHHTDADLLETKPGPNSEPNITPNNAEVHGKQNLETTDPIQPDHIEVKDEPLQEVLDYDVETTQVANGQNVYVITTSDGYLTIDSNFEKEIKSIKLETDNEEQSTDTNKDGSKNNAKQSKINDFLKSFEEEIKEFEHNSVDADDTDVKDTTYMLNNDPLRDDESLNSMDDIVSDISDCDIESLPMDEQTSESDSDLDSISDILEKAKDKKIKVNEIYDLELAEILLTVDRRNKSLKKRVQFLKQKGKIKDDILKLFENDEYDLGDGVKISKDAFLKIYERCEKSCYTSTKGLAYRFNTYYNFKDTLDKKKTDDFLRSLFNLYNPEYGTVFDIEYLDTEEKKLQEFNRRKDRAEYQNAPYQCARCYKGFNMERMHAYHMTKHDESTGPYECHICSLRFPTARQHRSHVVDCHSAVYMCRLCHVTFYYFASMQNHFNLHKGKEFPCPICNGIYRTATGLANHKRSHVTSHICTTCARSFVSAKGLVTHRNFKHKDAPAPGPGAVQCSSCSLTLDSQMAYKRHMKISHRVCRYVCNCYKIFPTMAELRQHKVDAGHQHNTRIKAERVGPLHKKKIICGKSRGAPLEKADVKTCTVCQEEVPNKFPTALYQHHERYHPGVPYQTQDTRVKNYLCEECGKQFHAHSLFMDHKNIHTGNRPYKCPECPRAFPSATYLWHHSVWHRPPTHKCKICGKLFKKSSNLGIHMRIHRNDRRYICDICPSSFIHAGSLTEHIRGVHLQQRRVRKRKQAASVGTKLNKKLKSLHYFIYDLFNPSHSHLSLGRASTVALPSRVDGRHRKPFITPDAKRGVL